MSSIKIEFPADRNDIALAIGKALTAIGGLETRETCETPPDVYEQTVPLDSYATTPSDDGGTGDPKPDTVGQCATQEQPAGDAPVAGEDEKVDEKGVLFNSDFCSKAAIPFYGSGKKKGQWKKRQGVDEGDYDEWYAGALFSGKIEEEEEDSETTSDTDFALNAFGGGAQTDENVPKDAGELMAWVSEQQTAGRINRQHVTDAYAKLKMPFGATLDPTQDIAGNCAKLYHYLKGVA